MIVKIDVKGQGYVDVEWEHNHSVETLEASNFRDLSFECIGKVNKRYESGHTPSTARQQYLKELRATCSDELTYHKKKATMLRKNLLCYCAFSTYYSNCGGGFMIKATG